MQQTQAVESILALDVGTAFTRAVLFDLVEGERRFCARGQAPSTLHPPLSDVSRGAASAIRCLEDTVGRQLLGPQGLLCPEQSDGRGVDDCFVVSSVGSLLRVLIVAQSDQALSALSREVAPLPGVEIVGTINLGAKLRAGESRIGRILASLHDLQPQVLLVVEAGDNKNALAELTQALVVASQTGGAAPAVIFAGGEESAAIMQRSLSDSHKLFRLPAGEEAGAGPTPLQERLSLLWVRAWQDEVPGAGHLVSLSGSTPASTPHGFASAIRFIAAHEQREVWALDIGAGTATAVRSPAGGAPTTVRSGLGLSQVASAMLGELEALSQWLPSPGQSAGGELADALLQRLLHAGAVPETDFELALQGALARAIGRQLLGSWPGRGGAARKNPLLLIGTGAVFAEAPGAPEASLLLLDAFLPVGFVELAVDRLGILPMLGAIAGQHPGAAADLVLREGRRTLGPCVAIAGSAKDGSVAAKITIESPRQTTKERAMFGEVKRLPLAEGEKAKVTFEPVGKLDCGAGPGHKATFSATGGPLGLIVDARGRPLVAAAPGDDHGDRLARWHQALRA